MVVFYDYRIVDMGVSDKREKKNDLPSVFATQQLHFVCYHFVVLQVCLC